MTPYRDWDQNSGVKAYEIGPTHIDVKFKDNSVYRYTFASAGAVNIEQMARLARAGDGLNKFINKVVRKRYSEKLS
jgi:hypothetical protein